MGAKRTLGGLNPVALNARFRGCQVILLIENLAEDGVNT